MVIVGKLFSTRGLAWLDETSAGVRVEVKEERSYGKHKWDPRKLGFHYYIHLPLGAFTTPIYRAPTDTNHNYIPAP
jgi:hypothetical protein